MPYYNPHHRYRPHSVHYVQTLILSHCKVLHVLIKVEGSNQLRATLLQATSNSGKEGQECEEG